MLISVILPIIVWICSLFDVPLPPQPPVYSGVTVVLQCPNEDTAWISIDDCDVVSIEPSH